MQVSECLERVLQFSSTGEFSSEIIQARIEYFNRMGKVHEDDPAFEARMKQFLDWYIFTRSLGGHGVPPAKRFFDLFAKDMSDEEAEIYRGLCNSLHSVFRVKKVEKNGGLTLVDLFTKRRHFVETEDSGGFWKRQIFEARLIPVGDAFRFSEAFCFHPDESYKFIKAEIKKLRAEQCADLTKFLEKLALLKQKYDLYYKANARQFYK